MALQIQIRRDTKDNWEESNPIMAHGEFGLENESITTPPLTYKVGDGINRWNDLGYANADPSEEIAEKYIHTFIATQDQFEETVSEGVIVNNALHEVKVNGVEWNSRNGGIPFPEGNISINFATGLITFHRPLEEGDQVVIKYN